MATLQQAKVKSVLSGDTLLLTGMNNPKAEKTISLAYVTAPRMKREGDESFAVEAREYLRKMLTGRVIQFYILYSIPQSSGSKREYCIVHMYDGHRLPELQLAEGMIKMREDAGRREESEEAASLVEKFRMLEARARADSKGIWSTEEPKIQTSYDLSNPQEFADKHKGQPIDAIIEKVLTGDRLVARLLESPTRHVQTMLLLAGIRAPNTKRINVSDGQEAPAEPLGDDARDFVESRLLQRRVQVYILGVSPQNQLIGSAKHPNGDIAIFELKAGLARCVDHHSTLLGQGMGLLRQAEREARNNRVGLFVGATAPKASSASQGDAVVSRVQTADTLYLRLPNGSEKRVNLSSVRQPKPSDPKQAPFGADAKEFMRRRLVGKHVKVVIDGKRAATDGYDEREMATITQNNVNVALTLVEAGYASVLRHKMDDPDRSPIYDELLAAEAMAQTEAKGMWSPKSPEAKQYVDYSENLEKAKRLLSLLSRQKRVPAIVDFVKSGSRFTLLIPKENAKITLVLSGIQAPKSARNATEASEPFGKEAHELASKRCTQRDVEIDVEDNDKNGGFIGKLYVNRENFAKTLLEEGFASVRVYSAEKSGNAAELLAAERKAKDGRKGLWHDYDPSQEADDKAAAAGEDETPQTNGAVNGGGSVPAAAPSKDYRDVVVTHVEDSCRIKLQQISPSTTGALSRLMDSFRKFHVSGASPKPMTAAPKAGEYVAARFSEDQEWYRARVRRNDREAKTSEIVYVDYGNSESRPWSELRALGKAEFETTALKAQAQEASLSFVQFPSGSQEYVREAQEWLTQRLSSVPQLVSRVDFVDPRDGTLWVSLFDPAASDKGTTVEQSSINAEVVEEGLAMVGRKLSRWERAQVSAIEGLRRKEQEAKDERRGMWEYGDLTED